MKTLQSFFVIALSLCATVTTHAQEKKFPVLKGPYLGQKPPGMKPEIFAQGIISMPTSKEYACTFSTDGNEFYYTITRNKTQMIM